MLGWYLFYVVFVLGPVYALCRYGQPEITKEVTLSFNGLRNAFVLIAEEQRRELQEIIEHNRKPS